MATYSFTPVGHIRSCFTEKFGIPRQPGLVPEAEATLEIEPEFCRPEAFRHLDTFSHVWIVFVFHQCLHRGWKPTVRPPRLGGNQRVGVFASRSGFRPNAIGQSAVKLVSIEHTQGRIELHLAGVDLLDGTPVLDIKPYLPYADAISTADPGYAHRKPPAKWPVVFAKEAARTCQSLETGAYPELGRFITALLSLDPRPAYRQTVTKAVYGFRLWDLNISFRFEAEQIVVEAIRNVQPSF